MQDHNDHVFVIAGRAAQGKTASLEFLDNPEGIACFNAEPKRLTFDAEFRVINVTDPYELLTQLQYAQDSDTIKTIVIESISYLMEMFETVYVINSEDSRSAWGQYQHYWKTIIHNHLNKMTKNIIFTAHLDEYVDSSDEANVKKVSSIPIKGALKKVGVESAFTTIVVAKCLSLDMLKGYENDLLTITEDDRQLGYKYVFQTRKTKDTIHEPIRSPRKQGNNMWNINETFIDNNAQYILNRLQQFYTN